MLKSLRYAYPSSDIARALGYSDESDGVWYVLQYLKKRPLKLDKILECIPVKGSNKEHIKSMYNDLQGEPDNFCLAAYVHKHRG